MSISTIELKKATQSLKTALQLLQEALGSDKNNIELHRALRDSCIQRFEFCVELSWKVSIKILGTETKAPNPAIREMAQNNLIDDPKVWFDFILTRNKSSHTYDEVIAQEVYWEVEKFVPELEKLLLRLDQIK